MLKKKRAAYVLRLEPDGERSHTRRQRAGVAIARIDSVKDRATSAEPAGVG
jgi:hypothetical protein